MQIVLNEDDIGLMNQYIETSNRLLTLQKQLKEQGVLDRIKASELQLTLGTKINPHFEGAFDKALEVMQPSEKAGTNTYTSLVPFLLKKGIEIRSVLAPTPIFFKLQSIAHSFWTLFHANQKVMTQFRDSILNNTNFKIYFKSFETISPSILTQMITDLHTLGAFQSLNLNDNSQGFAGQPKNSGHLKLFFNGLSYELYLRSQLEQALKQFGCTNFTIFSGMKIITKTRSAERAEISNELDVLAWVNNQRLIWIEAKSNNELSASIAKYAGILVNLRGGDSQSQQVQHIFVSRGAIQSQCTIYNKCFERAHIVNESGFGKALKIVIKEVLR